MLEIITTTKNKKYKFIKSLQQKKTRTSEGLFVVEGKKSVLDAIRSNCEIKTVAMSESFYNNEGNGINGAFGVLVISDMIFDSLCDTKTPQGVLAVIEMFNYDIIPENNGLYIYCDNVSDPGNLGTIIRSADAAGFSAVLVSEGSADIYNPKCVRSSMGSFFNIKIKTDFNIDKLMKFKNNGYSLYCGALSGDSQEYTEIDFKKPSVIAVGNEANGASQCILNESKHIIIPIIGKAESLNVGVAASIMMYEAVRQRKD